MNVVHSFGLQMAPLQVVLLFSFVVGIIGTRGSVKTAIDQVNAAISKDNFDRVCLRRDCPAIAQNSNCGFLRPGGSSGLGEIFVQFGRCMTAPVCGVRLDPLSVPKIKQWLPTVEGYCVIKSKNATLYDTSVQGNFIASNSTMVDRDPSYNVNMWLTELDWSPFLVDCIFQKAPSDKTRPGLIGRLIEALLNTVNDVVLGLFHLGPLDGVEKVKAVVTDAEVSMAANVTVTVDPTNPSAINVTLNSIPSSSVTFDDDIPRPWRSVVQSAVTEVLASNQFSQMLFENLLYILSRVLRVAAESCDNRSN